MNPAPRIGHYDWAGGRETTLRFGPEEAPIVVVALPLFEESNRTRAFANGICRALADRGIGSVLPDMPGQGDSLLPLQTVRLADLRTAHHDLVDSLSAGRHRTYAVGIRSGALLDLDSHVYGRWYLSPQEGTALLRELTRMRQDAPVEDGLAIEIAGNSIALALLDDLAGDRPHPLGSTRTVRLSTDPAPAERRIDGAPLWRRSEPTNDPALGTVLADDIADWITSCAG